MNEIIRRIVMMLGIVAIGTILIFFNTSAIITISATLAFGVIMAMGLGLLKKEDFKRLSNLKIPSIKKDSKLKKENKKPESKKESGTDKKNVETGNLLSRFHKKEKETNQTEKSKQTNNKGFSAGLNAAISSFITTVHKSRDNKHSEKIDNLLKTTIDEPVLSPSDIAKNQPESPLSDDMGLFDDDDFDSLDSLEIEGEETLFDFDGENPIESRSTLKKDSDTLNMDDEINAILLSGNALDEDDDFSSGDHNDIVSPEPQHRDTEKQDIGAEEGLFNSEEFFVQGIEDGLDEELFINLPNTHTGNQNTTKTSLKDSLDELSNITEFEKITKGDDTFSGFDAINLEELETDEFSLETDEIIIEEEEEISETDILPDDFISSPDTGNTKNELELKAAKNNLFDNSGINTLEIDDSMSFSGKNEYDDILNVLKSDIKTTKKAPQTSLVRDMKDVHVEAKELVEELEIVLHAMGGKSHKTNDQEERI